MADVEVSESNGATETVTDGIAHLDHGSVDAAELVRAANPLTPGTNSYFKLFRVHLISLTGVLGIETIRLYTDGSFGSGVTHAFNGSTVQATYDSANHKRTTFLQPSTTYTALPETMPTTDPLTANLGIGGSLTGQLTAAGYSDYALSGLTIGASRSTAGTIQFIVGYDSVV